MEYQFTAKDGTHVKLDKRDSGDVSEQTWIIRLGEGQWSEREYPYSAEQAFELKERVTRLEHALAAVLAIGLSRSQKAHEARQEARSLVAHIYDPIRTD